MNQNSKIKVLVKDTGLFAISNFGSKILIFLLTPLYTSILTAEEYGIADLITNTINFLYPILTLAIADATLRYALDKENDKSKVLNNSLLLTFISIGLLLIIYPFINHFNDMLRTYWGIFAVTYALFNIHNCIANFIKGMRQTVLFAAQGLIQTLSIIICNVLLLVVFKIGLDGYLISIIAGYAISTLVMIFGGKVYTYVNLKKLDWKLIKDMIGYSIPMIPTLLAWAINTSIDKYMIIGFVGLGASGVYSVAHKIPTIFTIVMSMFTQAWQISAIANYGSEDESSYYTKVYGALNIVSMLGCLLIMLLCKWFASILFVKDFYVAWRYVPILTVSTMFASHGGFLASAFRAAKKTNSLFISVLVGSVMNVILNWVLIKSFGVMGAAIATAISFIIIWLFRIVLVQGIVYVRVNWIITIVSYLFFISSAIIVAIDVPHAPIFVLLNSSIIVLLNYKDIRPILAGLLKIVHHRIRPKVENLNG